MNNKEWTEWINDLRQKVVNNTKSEEDISKTLAEKVENKILQISKDKEVGILFSGGVDSTLIAFVLHKHHIPFTAVTVGFHDEEQKIPDDIVTARSIAEKIGFTHHEKILNMKEMEKIFSETASILGKEYSNVVNIGVGSVEVAGIKEILRINPKTNIIMGGLGSEELYAGYQRHKEATNIQQECWNGLLEMYKRDMVREYTITQHFNVEGGVPFLDEEIILYSMGIPDKYKIQELSKHILRNAAILIGLPKESALRPKKAAQYGSRTDKAISKIAKQKGFNFKKEYIESI